MQFTIKIPRTERCPLIERKILYWQYVPSVFKWKNDCDNIPCPLNKNYQFGKEYFSAGVKDGIASARNVIAVIIYDERNPAFQLMGKERMLTWRRKELEGTNNVTEMQLQCYCSASERE